MDIFLVSDNDTEKAYRSFPQFQKMSFFKVSDGAGHLQGMRIHNAYIDRYCFEDPNYIACIETIHSSIGLTTNDGHIYLM
jgi:hypothetical protein